MPATPVAPDRPEHVLTPVIHPAESPPPPFPDEPPAPSSPASMTAPEPPASPPDPPSGPSLLQLGTLVVIGAMAANVVGFRYSRWAVGKDLHRAWERYSANTAARAHATRAAHSARAHSHRAREEHSRRAREEHSRRAAHDARRAAHDARERMERQAREAAREAHDAWERQFNRSRANTGAFWTSARVDVDPAMFEELLRAQRGARRGQADMGEDVMRELLRAAAAAAAEAAEAQARGGAGARRGRGRAPEGFEDFDPFRFWEEMEGARWRDASGQSREGTGGVFHRKNAGVHYGNLGVKPGASEKEVKAAYRKEAMKWHPDKYRGSDPKLAARKFREVTEAYNALKK